MGKDILTYSVYLLENPRPRCCTNKTELRVKTYLSWVTGKKKCDKSGLPSVYAKRRQPVKPTKTLLTGKKLTFVIRRCR